jgi:hypothetical protein
LIHSYDTPANVREEGLSQIRRYRARIGGGVPAYLVIFDRRPDKPAWEERLGWDEDGDVTVVGC